MPLFFLFDPFLRLKILVHFLGDLKTPKFPSEINWPLITTEPGSVWNWNFVSLTTAIFQKIFSNMYVGLYLCKAILIGRLCFHPQVHSWYIWPRYARPQSKICYKKVHYIWDLHRLKFSISLNLFNTAFSLQSGFVAT